MECIVISDFNSWETSEAVTIFEGRYIKMSRICLFIAMSLDGYIADSDGGCSWLVGRGMDSDNIGVSSEVVQVIESI